MYKIGLTLMVRARPDPITLALRLSVRRREIAHALPVWRKLPTRSVWIFRKTFFFSPPPENARDAHSIRRLASTRVCLSLFARVLSPLARDSRVPNTLTTTHNYDKK